MTPAASLHLTLGDNRGEEESLSNLAAAMSKIGYRGSNTVQFMLTLNHFWDVNCQLSTKIIQLQSKISDPTVGFDSPGSYTALFNPSSAT